MLLLETHGTCERSKFRWPKWSWASKNRATTLGGNCIGLTPGDGDGYGETVLAVWKRDGTWSQQLPFWTATGFCAFVFDSISYNEVKTLQIFRKFGMPGAKKKTNGNVFHTLARHHILKNTARKHLVGKISNNQSELPGKKVTEGKRPDPVYPVPKKHCSMKGAHIPARVTWTGGVASQVQIEMRCNRLLAQATDTCCEPNGRWLRGSSTKLAKNLPHLEEDQEGQILWSFTHHTKCEWKSNQPTIVRLLGLQTFPHIFHGWQAQKLLASNGGCLPQMFHPSIQRKSKEFFAEESSGRPIPSAPNTEHTNRATSNKIGELGPLD